MEKPKIRFKGYQEDWEQRKLPEFVSFFNGLTYTPDDVQETGTLVLRSSNVKNGEIVDADNVYVSDEVVTSENVKEGDIIVVVRNGSRALIGKHAQIKASMPNTVIGAFMSGIRSEHSSFVNALLDTSAFENEIAKNMGATINQITGYMFSKMEFMIPSGEEQDKIGAYFKQLDHLITLHQRKCEEMKILKKYMLQKMFPQNGQLVPQIRFSGFTEDWEQRKLGELGTVQTCKRIFKEQTSEQGDIPFFKNGTIGLEPDSYISREVYEEFRRLYPYPEVGDTLISVVGSIGRTAEYTGKDEYFQDSNVVWLKTDGSINKKFLKTSYQVIKWLIEGSTVKHLYNDNILRSELVMPVSQIEQAKIAEFFEALDNLITLHQQKCDELRNIKKFMLQNMFI